MPGRSSNYPWINKKKVIGGSKSVTFHYKQT